MDPKEEKPIIKLAEEEKKYETIDPEEVLKKEKGCSEVGTESL
jgi:hypothetical protein